MPQNSQGVEYLLYLQIQPSEMYRFRPHLKNQPAGLLGIGLCLSLPFFSCHNHVWSYPSHTHHSCRCAGRDQVQSFNHFSLWPSTRRRAPRDLFWKYLQTQRLIWHFYLLGTFRRQVLSQSGSGSHDPHFNYSHQGHSQGPECATGPVMPQHTHLAKSGWLQVNRVPWLQKTDEMAADCRHGDSWSMLPLLMIKLGEYF